jgi:catalase (peroxidase I)
MSNGSGCPFTGGGQKSQPRHMPSNRDWWPHYLNLSILHQHTPQANPMGEEFNYAEEFKSLDLAALRSDGTDLREPGRAQTANPIRSAQGAIFAKPLVGWR